MIVATAGHVDHGKTALIRALTGVDTDRLPEEKRRGLTIDLGFAYQDLGDGQVLGFVDVPGHEKFIRNMLAGVGAIDFALLVVAADDGIMPQTAEHLAILDLLAVGKGAVALSKIDTVDAGRRREVAAQLKALLAATSLADAPIFPLSTVTGEGVAALKAHIDAAARETTLPQVQGNFRLAIDRHFSLPGTGLVVTGSIYSGQLRKGDRLRLLQSATATSAEARVRGLHAQNRPAESARRGERCAVNIAAPDRGEIRRGDWLVAEAAAGTSRRFDVRLRRAPGAAPLQHWTPAHLHLATSDVLCRVALLDADILDNNRWAWARLYAERDLGGLRGDRFILRDQSARRTLAGGWVVDPLPPRQARWSKSRQAYLEALLENDPATALARALPGAPDGLDLSAFSRTWNLTPQESADLAGAVEMETAGGGGEHWALDPTHWRALLTALKEALGRWHEAHPERLGASAEQLGRALPRRMPALLVARALAELVARREIDRRGAIFLRSGHNARLGEADARLWQQLRPLLSAEDQRPPPLSELAAALDLPRQETEILLGRAAAMGLVVRVARNRYFAPETLRTLAELGEILAAENGFTAAAFRDRSGIGRNLTIDVLEFFDRARFTLRDGDHRRILLPATALFGGSYDK